MALVLIPAIFLQGCMFSDVPAAETPSPSETPQLESPPSAPTQVSSPAKIGKFTLRYDPKSALNPITSTSTDNILLSSLLYESLFILDGNLNVEPLLCESWSTDDDYTYSFVIKSNIAMSDGSLLTADDVAYTLKQATQKDRFYNRFRDINSITSDGDLTVKIVLNTENSQFIRLLDVPIIKYGSINDKVPPGTGPYVYSGGDSMQLDRFPQYRDYLKLPVTTIYLRECDDNEAAELFDDGELSLLWDDPSDTTELRLNRLHDKRYYETTALQFIGFNMRSVALKDPDVRRAIGYSIDRQYITENIMPRQTLAAPLAISPAYSLYDTQWENTIYDPQTEMAALLTRAGLSDNDEDSYLEYPVGPDQYQKFSLDFIVNSDNSYKVQVANLIAEALRRTGFDITVRELTFDAFTSALKSGDFDMYYGELVLSADFDFSTLLLPGSRHNYGGTGNTEYKMYIDDFLSAQTDEGIKAAAKQLCNEITINSPFVPVVYKRYVIYTPTGAVSGSSPSQSGIFNNFTGWTIDFTMLS